MPNVKWTKLNEDLDIYQFCHDPEGACVSRQLSLTHDGHPCLEMGPAQDTPMLGPVSPELARALIEQLVDLGDNRLHVVYREQGDQVWLTCWQSPPGYLTPWPKGEPAPDWSGMAPKEPAVIWDNLSGRYTSFRYDTGDSTAHIATGFTGEWPNSWVENLTWRPYPEGHRGPVDITPLGPMPFGVAHKLLQELWEVDPGQKWIIPYRLINGLIVLGIAKLDRLYGETTEPPEWFLNS